MTNCENNNTKMKGLLKGLRYISQIFDNEKEPEMEIGFPTDVKHVAHIGWDGPSVNTPSWMTEFKTPPQYSSSPLNQIGESNDGHKEKETETRRKNTQRGRDLPELPKASRRQHSTPIAVGGDGSSGVSPSRGKSDKARHRRSAKNTSTATDSPRCNRRSTDSNSGVENSPDIQKKNRRKKSKDANGGGSSKTKVTNSNIDPFLSPFSDPGPSPDKDNDLDYKKPPIFDEEY